MENLSLNTVNKLYIKCSDLVTIDDPIYLFRFFNEQSKSDNLIELSNEASSNPRFDLFSLNLPDDLDLKEGVYLWEVYQSDTTGRTDYEDMPLLSNGIAKVLSTFEENDTYEPTTGTDTVYNG